MKGFLDREFLLKIVIILIVSLGGWLLVVHPKVKELDDIHVLLRTVSQLGSESSNASVASLIAQMRGGREMIGEVEKLNSFSLNTSSLYGLISSIGAKHDIVVQSLNPGNDNRHTTDKGYSYTRIDMTLGGTYSNIASFIHDMKDLPGFIRPTSLTITPGGDHSQAIATANFSCEAIFFKLPDALRDIGGAS